MQFLTLSLQLNIRNVLSCMAKLPKLIVKVGVHLSEKVDNQAIKASQRMRGRLMQSLDLLFEEVGSDIDVNCWKIVFINYKSMIWTISNGILISSSSVWTSSDSPPTATSPSTAILLYRFFCPTSSPSFPSRKHPTSSVLSMAS